MVALPASPNPSDRRRPSTKWINETVTLTGGQLLELRNALEDLRNEQLRTNDRLSRLEHVADEFDRTVAVHDDRLDALEAGETPAAPILTPVRSPAPLAPARLMVARPIGGAEDASLQEFHDALATVVAGLLMYLRLGVAPAGLERICGIAILQAEHRFADEQAADAAEDSAADAWLAERSERVS